MPDPLLAEGARRSDVCWVGLGAGRPALHWHVWHDDAVHVVVARDGSFEDGAEVTLIVPSKDTRARLLTVAARATVLTPDDPRYAAAAAALLAARLNDRDPAATAQAWGDSALVLRLEPLDASSS